MKFFYNTLGYIELVSSGSVKKLTKLVNLKESLEKQTAIIVQQIILPYYDKNSGIL